MENSIVSSYLSTVKGLPLFYVVNGDSYVKTLDELKQMGLNEVRVSSFCKKEDKYPSIDDIVDFFRTADVDYKSNRYVLVGLGEYLALRGEDEILRVLRKLKDTTLGTARVIILLRHVDAQIKSIVDEDFRIKESQRYYVECGESRLVSIVNVKTEGSLGLYKNEGIKFLLEQIENGLYGKFYVKTNLDITNTIFSLYTIEEPYDAIKYIISGFDLCKEEGNDQQWAKLLAELQKNANSLQKVFERYGFNRNLEVDFAEKIIGLEFSNWLYYIALKYNSDKLINDYLKYVLKHTCTFDDFVKTTFLAITDFKHTHQDFQRMYDGRKKLVKQFSDSDVAMFIRENAIDLEESIYRLTDNTLMERQEIIRWISVNGLIPEIEFIYPDLFKYLKKYEFKCGGLSAILTEYFDRYKKYKLLNYVDDDFIESGVAHSKKYTMLDTRANALNRLTDKKSTLLFWIDALGVEYLSYIEELAKSKGLKLSVDIVRADLPTITTINKSFYDSWEYSKYKESELDDIKHKEKGGFDFVKCPAPIHLANELAVIESAINRAATELGLHTCKKFVIASDHGASRLAVITKKYDMRPTDTKGEHSGRCCKYFDGWNIENSVKDGEYIVLTDYSRFEGSRAANVEVHGGATLEETVIPLITLTLGKDTIVNIRILDSNAIFADRVKGTILKLYISDVDDLSAVKIIVNGKSYNADYIDKTHFSFVLSDVKKSGKYKAEVYEGDNLIGGVEFAVKSKMGAANSDFDELF